MKKTNNNQIIQLSAETVLTNLYQKVENVDQRLNSIDKTLERNTAQLEVHMKRSDQLESIVEVLKAKTETEIAPLKKHMNMIEGALKLLGGMSVVVGLLSGLAKLFGII